MAEMYFGERKEDMPRLVRELKEAARGEGIVLPGGL
jgi:hypothetical protein